MNFIKSNFFLLYFFESRFNCRYYYLLYAMFAFLLPTSISAVIYRQGTKNLIEFKAFQLWFNLAVCISINHDRSTSRSQVGGTHFWWPVWCDTWPRYTVRGSWIRPLTCSANNRTIRTFKVERIRTFRTVLLAKDTTTIITVSRVIMRPANSTLLSTWPSTLSTRWPWSDWWPIESGSRRDFCKCAKPTLSSSIEVASCTHTDSQHHQPSIRSIDHIESFDILFIVFLLTFRNVFACRLKSTFFQIFQVMHRFNRATLYRLIINCSFIILIVIIIIIINVCLRTHTTHTHTYKQTHHSHTYHASAFIVIDRHHYYRCSSPPFSSSSSCSLFIQITAVAHLLGAWTVHRSLIYKYNWQWLFHPAHSLCFFASARRRQRRSLWNYCFSHRELILTRRIRSTESKCHY